MAIAAQSGVDWRPRLPMGVTAAPSFGTSAIDGADENVTAIFRAPKTGNISKVLWAAGTVTSSATLDIRLETVDETTQPSRGSGTLLATNTAGTASPSSNSAVLVTLTAAAAVTRGDKIAMVVKQPSSSPGNMQVRWNGDEVCGHPYLTTNGSGSVVAIGSAGPIFGLEYDDGSYPSIDGVLCCHAITTTNFSNTSTPDEIGLRFKVNTPRRLSDIGVWLDADGDWNINFYDTDGATKLETIAVKNQTRRSTSADVHTFPLVTPYTLTKDAFYRVVVEPSSATNVSLYDFTVNTAAAMDANPGGQNWHLTSAKNPAAEGDWTNTTTRRPFIYLGFDGADDGTSTGGAVLIGGQGQTGLGRW